MNGRRPAPDAPNFRALHIKKRRPASAASAKQKRACRQARPFQIDLNLISNHYV